MDNVHVVQRGNRFKNDADNIARLLLRVRGFGHDAVKELATFDQLCDHEQFVALLKRFKELDDVFVVDAFQNVYFILQRRQVLAVEILLLDYLNRTFLAIDLVHAQSHHRKGSSAQLARYHILLAELGLRLGGTASSAHDFLWTDWGATSTIDPPRVTSFGSLSTHSRYSKSGEPCQL